MATSHIFSPFVALHGVYEFIDVFLIENEQEVWFLTLPCDAAVHFFMQSMMQNNTFFPDGKECLLRAFHPDTNGEVGRSRLVKQDGTLKVTCVEGVFTTLEAIKHATCPLCQGEAILLTDIAEAEPITDNEGELQYHCQSCSNVVTAVSSA